MNLKESRIIGTLDRGPGNPRNSEGSFLQLEDGRIAFAYSRFCGDDWQDHAACDICVIYSCDGGASFDTARWETLVAAADYGEKNVMSVTLRRMNNGDIGLFYMVKHPGITSDFCLRRYRGDFSHLISEVKCFPLEYDSYFVVNNDRVLHCADGSWMIPAAYHHSSTALKAERQEGSTANHWVDEQGALHFRDYYCDCRADVYFFVSRDDGRTWSQHPERLYMSDGYSNTGLQEPGLCQLQGGALYCYARTDRMYQYEAFSVDGDHWSTPQPSRFTSPDSPMLIKRSPYSGQYYAVWNPVPNYTTRQLEPMSGGRTPFVMAQSADGTHFSAPVLLEDDPTRGYCYPALEFLDEKTLLLAYCSGGVLEGSNLNRTVIRRLTLE